MTNGHLEIIEYSDLPAELAESRNPDGTLRFIAGSPAIHMISRAFVEKLTAGGSLKLPWHRADKKVPFVDEAGNPVKPAEPNAVKLESFIFDAMPLASRTMVLEGKREDLFAPTKNPTGVDSVESCRAMLIDRDARRLEAAGVKDRPRRRRQGRRRNRGFAARGLRRRGCGRIREGAQPARSRRRSQALFRIRGRSRGQAVSE